jgi:regulator of RNase E activity RraA
MGTQKPGPLNSSDACNAFTISLKLDHVAGVFDFAFRPSGWYGTLVGRLFTVSFFQATRFGISLSSAGMF